MLRFGILAAVLVLAVPLRAQQFQDLKRMMITADQENAFGIAVGDVNRDGAPDYFMANLNSRSKLYLNDGNGHFTDASFTWLPSNVLPGGSAAMGDVNGDAFIDIVQGTNTPRGLQLLLFDAKNQKFVEATNRFSPKPTGLYYDMKLGDIDLDKDLDLVISPAVGQSALYINDGKGNFTAASSGQFPSSGRVSWGVTFMDLDRDNDLDIVFHTAGTPTVYQNTKGRFKDISTTVVPGGFTNSNQRKVVAGDFNGDGFQDLFFGNYIQQNKLLLWDIGNKRFRDATSSNMPVNTDGSYMLGMGDVDDDGDLDVVSGNWASSGAQNTLYLNDGKGKFTESSNKRWAAISDQTTVLALADVDQDGDLDAIVGNWIAQNRVAFNTHRHVYAPNAPLLNSTHTIDFHGMPGYATRPQVIIPLVGVVEAKPHIAVPPFTGRLGTPLSGLIVLPSVVLKAPGGKFSTRFAVPNKGALKGLQFYVQSLMAQPPNPVDGFANLFADKIQ